MDGKVIIFTVERDRLSVRLQAGNETVAEEAATGQLTESALLATLDVLLGKQGLTLADIADIRVDSPLAEHSLSRRMAETAAKVLLFAKKSRTSSGAI